MLIYKLRSSLYTLDWSMAVARTIKVHDCRRCYTLDPRAERIKSFRSICDHAAFNSLISFVLYVCVFALALIYGRWIYIEEAHSGKHFSAENSWSSRPWRESRFLALWKTSGSVHFSRAEERWRVACRANRREQRASQQERKIPPLHSSDFAVCWFEDVSGEQDEKFLIYGLLAFLHLWTWSHSRYGYLHLTVSVNWAEHNYC